MIRVYRSFQISIGNYCGVADLSELQNGWFYFNKLSVQKQIRRRRIGSRLLEQIVIWADTVRVNIYLPINPYGGDDSPGLEDLVTLYERYGFILIEGKEGSMYRLYTGNNEIPDKDFFDDLFNFN